MRSLTQIAASLTPLQQNKKLKGSARDRIRACCVEGASFTTLLQSTMVRQTQIHRKSNFRILESEGAQKFRTYITKKTPKKFLFITCSLGATAISANPVFHEKGNFRVFFPILIIELRDQNYKIGSAIPPNYPSSPIFICQCSP